MVTDTSSTNWLFDIFSWEHLMAVTTVFALLTTTAIVPMWQLIKKRNAEKAKILDEKETAKIKAITEEIVKPVAEKINKHDDKLNQLQEAAKENDRDTRDTLNTLKDLTKEFQQYRSQQDKLNAKLYFLEGSYRNNARGYKDWRTGETDNSNVDSP